MTGVVPEAARQLAARVVDAFEQDRVRQLAAGVAR